MTTIAKPAIIPKNRKPGTLHSFFALKFHEGNEDRTKIEAIEKALRKLKKKLDKEGTLKELRNRRHYEKPSEIKRREKQRRH